MSEEEVAEGKEQGRRDGMDGPDWPCALGVGS